MHICNLDSENVFNIYTFFYLEIAVSIHYMTVLLTGLNSLLYPNHEYWNVSRIICLHKNIIISNLLVPFVQQIRKIGIIRLQGKKAAATGTLSVFL